MKTSSGACQTCKTRRVKCDENKPSCQRCIKAKRICIPASTTRQTSFSIHNENDFASGRAKRPRGPRSSFILHQPEPDLETKALAYYNQYHLQVIPNAPIALGGLSECVAAWRASGRTDPMVDLALSAMSLAVYANVHNDSIALNESSAKYYRLLQIVQQRIAKVDPPALDEQDIDACLLTIFFMGRYEGATHNPTEQNPREHYRLLQSWSHHEGAMAILKIWFDNPSLKSASEIVKHIRRGQIRSAVLRSRILPNWLIDGARFGEGGAEIQYDRVIVRTVLLRQSLACAQQRIDVSTEEIDQLLQEARDIQVALEDWFHPMSKACPRYQLHYDAAFELPAEHFYGSKISNYREFGHAGIWTQYHGAKLLVIGTHLRILELGSPDLSTYCSYRHERHTCIDRLIKTTNDLASSVPFCLERIKAIDANATAVQDTIVINKDSDIKPYITGLLVWPLTIASSLREVDAAQRKWFKSELASIGKIVGDGMLKSARSETWNIVI